MTTPPHGPDAADRSAQTRRSVLLRLDPAVHDAIARWAADDLRSVNAQITMLLQRALADAGRAPTHARPPRRPGRPRRDADPNDDPNDGADDPGSHPEPPSRM